MVNTSWYRKTTWTAEGREVFFKHLKRSRSNYKKAQYVRIQALYLQNALPPDYTAALELLDYLFRECPDPNEISMAYLQKSQCLDAIGAQEDAVDSLRAAAQADAASGPRSPAICNFAFVVASRSLKHLYDDVLKMLSKARDTDPILILPFMQFQALAAMAIIGFDSGKVVEARQFAQKALVAWDAHRSGHFYPKDGQVIGAQDSFLLAKIEKLANGRKSWWKFW